MRAYILLSGGMDSTTLLAKAIYDFGPGNVEALSIDYGQQHKEKELACAKEITIQYGVNHTIRSLKEIIGRGGLSDPGFTVPDISYDQIQGVSPTYVPFRNGLLLSSITSFAVGLAGQMETINPDFAEGVIGYGAHAEDAQNWAYPDCTPEFIGAMANAIYIGTYHKFRLYTPLMWLTKAEIVELGTDLDVQWDFTWSCYKGEELHCGTCPTCLARQSAFNTAGVLDPTEYAS